jgi:hypothetical protein
LLFDLRFNLLAHLRVNRALRQILQDDVHS